MEMLELNLRGDSHYELGKSHGAILRKTIQEFVQQGVAGINRTRKSPIAMTALPELISPYLKKISQQLPDFEDEIRGLADGAQIPLEAAVLLQIRREVIGTNQYTLTGDCSSVGIFKNEGTILAQTIDLDGSMTNLGNVFRISKRGKPEILQYCFAGLLGYMGMNSAGLAVAINLVVSDGWSDGISPYLLARKFLEQESIDECLQVVKTVSVASSRSFLIVDRTRLVTLEITPDDYRVIEGIYQTHANHFLHPDFAKVDRLNVFSKNSSIKRMIALDSYIKADQNETSIKRAFADHSIYPVGICAHSDGMHNETVASVIMHPHQGKFLALKGKPCQNQYVEFRI
ncbi:MAG: C45 family autoproteolytic acyltransferase/hydrolase [Cyclobacteriaceae bacterium]|jgi:isopenicillin-N N-acyltransferase-like protein